MKQPTSLLVRAAGMCCSLGWHLDAIVCALRANMDHFCESDFVDLKGQALRVAALKSETALGWGRARWQHMMEWAIRDCLQEFPQQCLPQADNCALVLLCPPQHNSLLEPRIYAEIAQDALEAVSGAYGEHEHEMRIVPAGRAGLARALTHANELLKLGHEHVLLLSCDSMLHAAHIQNLLEQERLLTSDNADGFIPGEAAAALLLQLAAPVAHGLHIRGLGQKNEAGGPDGSVPSRGQALSRAIRGACAQAGWPPAELDFRISDQNGEEFFSSEASNAMTRVLFGAASQPAHLSLAEKTGEIGAASGLAMLAWMQRDMARRDCSPGRRGLLHLANDDGLRCAVTIEYQGEMHNGNPRLR